jgi:hypothetical protein
LILDFEFDQHLESHKHVISLIMGFRDTGCYKGVAAGAHGRGGEWRRSSVARGGVNWGAEAPFIGLGEGLRRQEKAVVCRSYGGGVNGDF